MRRSVRSRLTRSPAGLGFGQATLRPVQVGDDAAGGLREVLRKVDFVVLRDELSPDPRGLLVAGAHGDADQVARWDVAVGVDGAGGLLGGCCCGEVGAPQGEVGGGVPAPMIRMGSARSSMRSGWSAVRTRSLRLPVVPGRERVQGRCAGRPGLYVVAASAIVGKKWQRKMLILGHDQPNIR